MLLQACLHIFCFACGSQSVATSTSELGAGMSLLAMHWIKNSLFLLAGHGLVNVKEVGVERTPPLGASFLAFLNRCGPNKLAAIRTRSETYCELKTLVTNQRGRNSCKLRRGVANSIRAIRTEHLLTVESQGLSEYSFEYGCLSPKAQFLSFDDGGFLSPKNGRLWSAARIHHVMWSFPAKFWPKNGRNDFCT